MQKNYLLTAPFAFVFALHLPFQMAFLSELTNLRSDSEPHFRNLHQWYFEIAQKNKNLGHWNIGFDRFDLIPLKKHLTP